MVAPATIVGGNRRATGSFMWRIAAIGLGGGGLMCDAS